jgi:hypothetical protein
MHRIEQVTQIAAQTVEFPDQEPIDLSKCLQTSGQARPCIEASRRQVFIDLLGSDAGGQQHVPLHIQDLGAIRLGNPHIADQHCDCVT